VSILGIPPACAVRLVGLFRRLAPCGFLGLSRRLAPCGFLVYPAGPQRFHQYRLLIAADGGRHVA
jgi:hypothetical protein